MLTATGATMLSAMLGVNGFALDAPPTLPPATIAAGLREARCTIPPDRAKIVGSEWLGRELQIVEVTCWRTPAGAGSILFAVPVGEPPKGRLIVLQDWRNGRIVSGYRVAAPGYDRDSRTLSSTENISRKGDCGTIKEWKWTGWSFRLINVWRKDSCDGEEFEWDSRHPWQVFPKPAEAPRHSPSGLEGRRGEVSTALQPPKQDQAGQARRGADAEEPDQHVSQAVDVAIVVEARR